MSVTSRSDDEHASCAMAPLLVNATGSRARPGVIAAFAGVATVRQAVVAIDADFCILMDASASISICDVAGLDEKERSAAALLHSG